MQNKKQNQLPDSWQREQWTMLTTSAMVLAGVALAFILWIAMARVQTLRPAAELMAGRFPGQG